MKSIRKENKFCTSCMQVHDVDIVKIKDENIFKNELIEYEAIYEFCANTDEYSQTEEMIRENDISFKDAYRKKINLLTSGQIKQIREQYDVSQKDFAKILQWGEATIARYETYQVQDIAHNDILVKVGSDPDWYMDLLKRSEGLLSEKLYLKYMKRAKEVFNENKNEYLVNYIEATYSNIDTSLSNTGGVKLDLDKVVEIINYLAMKVSSLHTVKLMKMLWYSDFLNYKRYGKSITGLAYESLPMGAVPVSYKSIISLNDVCYEEVIYDENIGNKFYMKDNFKIIKLEHDEIQVINKVINECGNHNANEIVTKMHNEEAYKCTNNFNIISYEYANQLSIE